MRSWKPRGPSARLEARLFGQAPRRRTVGWGGGQVEWLGWIVTVRQAFAAVAGFALLAGLFLLGSRWSGEGAPSESFPGGGALYLYLDTTVTPRALFVTTSDSVAVYRGP